MRLDTERLIDSRAEVGLSEWHQTLAEIRELPQVHRGFAVVKMRGPNRKALKALGELDDTTTER